MILRLNRTYIPLMLRKTSYAKITNYNVLQKFALLILERDIINPLCPSVLNFDLLKYVRIALQSIKKTWGIMG